MPLQFINQTTGPEPSPADRRLIRSHVMKGKNAGRPRPSRKKPRQIAPIKRVLRYPQVTSRTSDDISISISRSKEHDSEHAHKLCPNQPLWHDLALISFPQQLSTESRRLIYQWFLVVRDAMYPPGFCSDSPAHTMDSVWFYYTFLDEAYFHCVLAVSASYSDWFMGNPEISPVALDQISKAYHLVNQTLSGSDAVSDRAIAVVTMLAIYQRLHQEQPTGLIHFYGLQRMIQLRGGIGQLVKENRALAAKPLRLDVEFALQDGSPTRFPIHQVPSLTILDEFQCRNMPHVGTAENLDPLDGIDPNLHLLKADVISFAHLLNTRQEEKKLNPLDYTESVLSILHRLVHFAPLGGPRPNTPLDNIVHLTLVALMTTLLPNYGYARSGYRVMCDHVKSAVRNFKVVNDQSGKVMLWTLFVTGASVLDDKDRPWLLPLLEETCRRLHLRSWAEARQMLTECCWIHVAHDNSGHALWEAIQRRRND